MYTNCDQLINKFDELLTVIYSDYPDIILLVETIPKAQKTPIGLSSLSIPNYSLFTNFDPESSDLKQCGRRGICIYVANHLCPSEIYLDSNMNEHLWVKLKLSRDYLIIGSVYHSPSENISNSTTELCDLISKVV